MSVTTYLSGRVVHQQLPDFDGAPGPDAPALKRLRLPQGELAQIHQSDEGMRYIAWIELRAGGVRGNHYHERKLEHVYVISGEVELTVEDLTTRERATLRLKSGDLVSIEVRIAHAFRPISPGQAIEFSPGRLAPDDTFRFPLVT